MRQAVILRNVLSVMLSALLALPSQSAQQPPPTVQEKVGEISSGSIVEVKTRLKDMKKVRGRLGPVTDEGFSLQVANGSRVETVNLKYADVKSISEKSQSGRPHTGIYILAGVGAALAVLFTVVLVAAAATSN